MKMLRLFLVLLLETNVVTEPIVIGTWDVKSATNEAWFELKNRTGKAVEAVVSGVNLEEEEAGGSGGSVGYGGSPDENGETALDAMLMNGATMDVGSVANLRFVKNAMGVAQAVMKYTTHTLLVGNLASDFAVSMGFERTNLSTPYSIQMYESWKAANCQPNFWENVVPDPRQSCGPYQPAENLSSSSSNSIKAGGVITLPKNQITNHDPATYKHDTIGLVAIDDNGNVAAGTSTNGASHKIPGRVGDSPCVGSGSYADNEVGGAAATGDGDIMVRFVPSFHVVLLMKFGLTPTLAAQEVIARIARFYPSFSGGIVAVTVSGEYGAACHGLSSFPFTVMMTGFSSAQTFSVSCI